MRRSAYDDDQAVETVSSVREFIVWSVAGAAVLSGVVALSDLLRPVGLPVAAAGILFSLILPAAVLAVARLYLTVLRRRGFVTACLLTCGFVVAVSVVGGCTIVALSQGPAPISEGIGTGTLPWAGLSAVWGVVAWALSRLWPARRRSGRGSSRSDQDDGGSLTDEARWLETFRAELRSRNHMGEREVRQQVAVIRRGTRVTGQSAAERLGTPRAAARTLPRRQVNLARRALLLYAVISAFAVVRLVDVLGTSGRTLTGEVWWAVAWVGCMVFLVLVTLPRALGRR